jgi:hypothetical protein
MYQDDSTAAQWKSYALERERCELQEKLRKYEETIQKQTQEILALQNKKPGKTISKKVELLEGSSKTNEAAVMLLFILLLFGAPIFVVGGMIFSVMARVGPLISLSVVFLGTLLVGVLLGCLGWIFKEFFKTQDDKEV